MELESFSIGPIRDLVCEEQFGFVSVYFSFRDDATNACPSMTIEVPIQYERNWTVQRVREAAFSAAMVVLRQVLDVAESASLEALEQAETTREADKQRRLAEMGV